jgi:F0F1-type ATP synthase assembly protein I
MTSQGRDRDPGSKPPTQDRGPSAGDLAGAGFQFAAVLLASVFAGQWLDRKFGTGSLFLLIGVFGGAGLAFYSMYRRLMAGHGDDAGRRKR